jgi:hypothetical protein
LITDSIFIPLVILSHDVRAIAAQPLVEAGECVLKRDAAGTAHALGFIIKGFPENGSAKVCHGSGGIVLLRAE